MATDVAHLQCGIEFEYMIVDTGGATPGRIRDFSNLPFDWIRQVLDDKPGRDDPELATGDLGIKSGYWYLEGDERFNPDGSFNRLEVKGVEIRTPPMTGVPAAVQRLLEIEAQLSVLLARSELGLAIAGFNPNHMDYRFVPPLNPWETVLRRSHRGYDGSHISTLSYGPDVNLSMPGSSFGRCLDAARKLNYYAPYIVPFSFSSPFFAGQAWNGYSKRTFERSAVRPAVKLYLDPATLAEVGDWSQLLSAARLPREAGRIEFKAYDAMPTPDILAACCHLLVGICLAADLPGRSEKADLPAYRRAATAGFDDPAIHDGATEILNKAIAALALAGDDTAVASLALLEQMLAQRRTPSHDMLDAWHNNNGPMYKPGGHLQALPLAREIASNT